MTLAGRDEAMARWMRQREIGDLESELAGLEDQLRLTPENTRRMADLRRQIARLQREDQPGARPAGTLL